MKKYVKAVNEWMDSIKKWKEEGKVSFDSAPSSATGQYDRLYNAIQHPGDHFCFVMLVRNKTIRKFIMIRVAVLTINRRMIN